MNTSAIEWTEKTWNPVTGCTPVSAGCDHCYARRMARRLRGRCGYPADDPFRVTLHEGRLDEPLHLCKPRRIFVVSMGDLLHKDVPFDFINRVFGTMCLCPQHIFQVLTKRAERLPRLMSKVQVPWPLPNVWLGVTAENQETADERIPLLLQTPAAVRYVSLEPLLGPVDLRPFLVPKKIRDGYAEVRSRFPCDGPIPDHLRLRPFLHWVIVGGETSPGARPMEADWARSIRDQCAAAGVPFFFKHWGGPHKAAGRLLDGRAHDAMPETGKGKP